MINYDIYYQEIATAGLYSQWDELEQHVSSESIRIDSQLKSQVISQAQADAQKWALQEYREREILEMRNIARERLNATNIATVKDKKPFQQQIQLSEKLLNDLESEKLITKEPLKWVGAKNLCAYFVDNYFKAQTKKWETGKKLFGVGNLAQLKDLYENNKTGKPRNYQIIDEILHKNK